MDKRNLIKHYCEICKKIIGWKSFIYGSKLCRNCSRKIEWKNGKRTRNKHYNIGNNNPMHGIHRFGEEAPCWIDGRSY